jgi:glycosyltransferase involved in cell wall biosynthesis
VRVCYFGAFDPFYPRNRVLRHGLEMAGVEVETVNAPSDLSTARKAPLLIRQFRRLSGKPDVVLLSEFGQTLAPLAWALARLRGARLVVDFFTSLYDTAVLDRAQVGPGSPTARYFHALDRLALRLADLALTDTVADADYAAVTFGVRRAKLCPIPVGAPTDLFSPETPPLGHKPPGTLALFYGTYIPLHGVETILRAAVQLHGRAGLHFELLGSGQTYSAMRALAAQLGLDGVTFSPRVPPFDLARHIARADIGLGIFGSGDKAARVVPNKVYQMLAMRRAVISADTPALREMFIPGEHLLAVPPGDPDALAKAISALAADPSRRDNLAEAGYRAFRAAYTPDHLGARLRDALEAVLR